MSVAIIYCDNGTSTTGSYTKREITTLASDAGGIVKNFNTGLDTFALEGGTYRFDWTSCGGQISSNGQRASITNISPLVGISETPNQVAAKAAAFYDNYNLTGLQLFDANESYFLGTVTLTTTGVSHIFTKSNHGLKVGDQVYFSNSGGAVFGGITEFTRYYVIVAGTANTFRVSATSGGAGVNVTAGSGTNSVWKDRGSFVYPLREGRSTLGGGVFAVPEGAIYTFSLRQAFGLESGHNVTATLGGAALPNRYLQLKIIKTA